MSLETALTILYELPELARPAPSYRCQVLRLDTMGWLDPADLAGATWSEAFPEAGWPMAALPAPVSALYRVDLPIGGWPDATGMLVVIFAEGAERHVGYEFYGHWKPYPLPRGKVRVSTSVRIRG